ncbi:MAG TPA: hypothetical protein VEI03_10295 [Stellaceae bacterium]|nr:hypothetical protein [Stellaceae bacterium]
MALVAAIAILAAACAARENAIPVEKVWRNGGGVPVDPRYGTPLPGSPPEF